MRALVVTQIFPNARHPEQAPFNQRQFCELGRLCDVQLLALVPWFPGASLFDRSRRIPVPREERVDGMRVLHPRVLYIPRIAPGLSGPLFLASLLPQVLAQRTRYDVVLGAFAYPDGWAATELAHILQVPCAVKLHGSDINRDGRDPELARHVRATVSRADAVVAPSQALVERAVALGARPERAQLIMNGVDRRAFRIRERAACRTELGQRGERRKRITFIGRLERAKGVLDLLEAVTGICRDRSDTQLVLVGDGADRRECERIVKERALPALIAGARPPGEIPLWIGASEVVALPSWAEGTPNVLIEAIASGRRVVATRVGGIPALVNDTAGELVMPRQPVQLARALSRSLAASYDPSAVAASVHLDDWAASAAALHRVLERLARDGKRSAA